MFDTFLSSVAHNVVNPFLALLGAIALLVFIWGMFEFIRDSGSDTGREKGRQHMTYGVIGLFIMISAFGIINIIARTIQDKTGDSTGVDAIPRDF
jgi:TRAP-type C4-dicarboxylate transport system permease small subunit